MTPNWITKLERLFFLLIANEIVKNMNWSPQLDTLTRNFQFSTDVLDDQSSVVAVRVYNETESLIGLSLQTVGSNFNKTCFVPFQPIEDLGILPIRRLSYKTVLLSVHELGQNLNDTDSKLVLVNTESCEYKYAYKETIPKARWIFIDENPSDERFTLIMYGRGNCRGYNWCRLFFDPLYQKFESLDFDFHPYNVYGIKPATTFDGNRFIVHHNDLYNTYRVYLYDLSDGSVNPKYKELLTFQDFIDVDRVKSSITPLRERNVIGWGYTAFRYEVKSSGLSTCWCLNQHGNETIHCSVFREDGSLKFNQSVTYPEARFPLRVESIPNGLILFSIKHTYSLHEWTKVQVDVITRDVNDNSPSDPQSTSEENHLVQMKHHFYDVACIYIVGWKVKVNESNGSMEVEYICHDYDNETTEAKISNHVLYIH